MNDGLRFFSSPAEWQSVGFNFFQYYRFRLARTGPPSIVKRAISTHTAVVVVGKSLEYYNIIIYLSENSWHILRHATKLYYANLKTREYQFFFYIVQNYNYLGITNIY